jgi:hypothetical protein
VASGPESLRIGEKNGLLGIKTAGLLIPLGVLPAADLKDAS